MATQDAREGIEAFAQKLRLDSWMPERYVVEDRLRSNEWLKRPSRRGGPLKEMLARIPDRATVTVDTTRADFIDHDVRELLDRFVADATQRSIVVEMRHTARSLIGAISAPTNR